MGYKLKIRLHKKQEQAIVSNKRIVNCISGIQGGKTLIGALKTRVAVSRNKDRDVCFIVTVPTYKTWAQATSFHFNRLFGGLGEHNKLESVFNLYDGRKIYIRSMDNVWSIEGITNCVFIWNDEVGQNRYQAWVNIMGRAAFKEAQIFNTTTPYALNWLYHDLYKPWTEGKLSDVDVVQWRSIDNPYFPKSEYERQRKMLDSRVFAMKYEGTFQKMAGLVYEDFDRDLNQKDDFDWRRFRERYYVYAGVDWGFSNPFAVVVRLIARDGSEDYQLDEFMRSYMTPEECVRVARDLQRQYGIEVFFCDEEAPDYIKAFNNAGLHASPVKKGKGSVMEGIGLHNTLIKTRMHKLIRGKNPLTMDEYETYQFAEKIDRYENSEEKPVDANNHLLSATRYVTMATQWIRDRQEKINTYKPVMSRIEQLKIRKVREVDWAFA